MSVYESVLVYSSAGDFLGYTIKRSDVLKLQTTNLYGEHEVNELQEQLGRLNGEVSLRQFWPHVQDPAVQALLKDQTFCPIEYIETEVIDRDRSHLVYVQTTIINELGHETQIDSEDLDELASVLTYKTVLAPKNPSDHMVRIKQASEQIARQRAQAAGLQV